MESENNIGYDKMPQNVQEIPTTDTKSSQDNPDIKKLTILVNFS